MSNLPFQMFHCFLWWGNFCPCPLRVESFGQLGPELLQAMYSTQPKTTAALHSQVLQTSCGYCYCCSYLLLLLLRFYWCYCWLGISYIYWWSIPCLLAHSASWKNIWIKLLDMRQHLRRGNIMIKEVPPCHQGCCRCSCLQAHHQIQCLSTQSTDQENIYFFYYVHYAHQLVSAKSSFYKCYI